MSLTYRRLALSNRTTQRQQTGREAPIRWAMSVALPSDGADVPISLGRSG